MACCYCYLMEALFCVFNRAYLPGKGALPIKLKRLIPMTQIEKLREIFFRPLLTIFLTTWRYIVIV